MKNQVATSLSISATELADEHVAPSASVNALERAPVVVVGSGPAGVRFCHELLKRSPQHSLLLIGDEAVVPYNRVQLSALLAGDVSQDEILNPLPDITKYPNFKFVIGRVAGIDAQDQMIRDTFGQTFHYSKLVLAIGSNPHEPNIPGIDLRGVYTFRNMRDTEHLYSRTARSRHLVVVGGGLLGIEAARALQKANTEVTLVQQANRLMNRQLDETASAMLRGKVEQLGIKVITKSGVRVILGDERVSGVRLYNEQIIECDTVLLCAGIKPNVQLARDVKLKVATGILVDDQLQTSEKNIYAIGECCEHRGLTYGLVTPGLEQAAAAAAVVAGQTNISYTGSFAVNRLKVLSENVCSMGEVSELTFRPRQFVWSWRSRKQNMYRKLVTTKGRLSGILCFGEWDEVARAQEAWQNQRRLMPWHILRFLLTGFLWGRDSNVSAWPAHTIVCQCNNVSQGELARALETGCNTLQSLRASTRAATTCGSCKPLLESMLGDQIPRERELAWPAILFSSLSALLIASLLVFLPAIGVSDSVQNPAPFEHIWNDKTWKQITGFTLLGLSLIGLLMSLRKRIKVNFIQRLGNYAWWRLAHLVLGLLCAALLFFHTGMHFGENLNLILMTSFVGTILLGAITGAVLSLSHTLPASTARKLRTFWTWAHTFIVWPLPVLVSMHILTVYYF